MISRLNMLIEMMVLKKPGTEKLKTISNTFLAFQMIHDEVLYFPDSWVFGLI